MLISSTPVWTVTYFNERIQQQIFDLPKGILGDYLRLVDLLEVYGADLRMPHSKALGDKLLELRLSGQEGAGRVFYCTLEGRQIVVLHSFIKKTEQTPPKELRIARRRLKEFQEND
jgi:phage-related protein